MSRTITIAKRKTSPKEIDVPFYDELVKSLQDLKAGRFRRVA